MTKLQLSVALKVIARWREGKHYLAQGNERSTLVILCRTNVLARRKHPHKPYEYRPSNEMLTELAREAGVGSTAELMPATTGDHQAIARKAGRS